MDTRSGLPHLAEIVDATARYLAGLTVLTEEQVRAPTVLPGWTRGHVITHLARNADGLSNVLHAAQTGEPIPMYPSSEKRDAEIEAGSRRPVAELVEDSIAAAGRWLQAANELHAANLEAKVQRTPDADPWPVYRVGAMRWTEVLVHHADLGLDFTAYDWPAAFVEHLLRRRRRELEAKGVALTWRTTDTGETTEVAGGGTEVIGHSADLAWWLIGRGEGAGLVSSAGALPDLGRWA